MSKMMQINLRTENDAGNAIMTTWVEYDQKLKVGQEVQLKGSSVWWKITDIYANVVELDVIDMNRGWTNNI